MGERIVRNPNANPSRLFRIATLMETGGLSGLPKPDESKMAEIEARGFRPEEVQRFVDALDSKGRYEDGALLRGAFNTLLGRINNLEAFDPTNFKYDEYSALSVARKVSLTLHTGILYRELLDAQFASQDWVLICGPGGLIAETASTYAAVPTYLEVAELAESIGFAPYQFLAGNREFTGIPLES